MAVHSCPRRCGVLHANLGPLKCIARFMHANPSCTTWAAFRRALASPALRHRQVGEIAFDWGFNDLSHFGRTFRERYGLSPRAFRLSQSHD